MRDLTYILELIEDMTDAAKSAYAEQDLNKLNSATQLIATAATKILAQIEEELCEREKSPSGSTSP